MRFTPLTAVLALVALVACQDLPSAPETGRTGQLEPSGADLARASQGPAFVPGQVLVRTTDDADVSAVAAAHGASVAARGYQNRFAVLEGAVGNETALTARLRDDDRVVWAEPNWLRQPHAIDSRLWAFYNPGGLSVDFTRGQNKGSPVSSYFSTNDADEDNVEGYGSGGSPVVIGSIDTGVDFSHPEFLSGQLIAGHDWYNDDTDPSDDDGHGTHTTGTMVGQTVGVAGVSGAGPNVQVYVQKVCGAIGCPTSAIANAINAAADYPGMVAMNLSLGGGALGQAEADAIAHATANDVLVIASAGNDGTSTVSCPACDPNAISVAASNWQDELSYYSNWGSGLDITAPGGELYSNTTDEAGIYSSVPGGYAYYQGTSMAAPQVTGTAGVVASVTGLSGAQLRSRIEGTTDDLGASGYDQTYGNGRLNSYRAATNTTLDESGGGNGGGTLAASFSYGCSGATCTFDGSGSTGATSWDWESTDGWTASGETASHSFTAGTWTVTLTVGDGDGGTDSTSTSINCKSRGPNGLSCR
jgi:serine protease